MNTVRVSINNGNYSMCSPDMEALFADRYKIEYEKFQRA
jgi:hypothetical protein